MRYRPTLLFPLAFVLAAAAPIVGNEVDVGIHADFPADAPAPQFDVCYNPDADQYFVAYTARIDDVPVILGQKIDASGGGTVDGPITLQEKIFDGDFSSPSVAYAPGCSVYMLTFRERPVTVVLSRPYCRFFDGGGSPITEYQAMDEHPDDGGGGPWPADIAFDGTEFLAVWCDEDNEPVGTAGLGLLGRKYSIAGEKATELLTLDGQSRRAPAIAYLESASCYMAACVRRGDNVLVALRVALDGSTEIVQELASGESLAWPRIAANPVHGECLVTWESCNVRQWAGRSGPDLPPLDRGDIYFVRVGEDASSFTAPIPIQDGIEIDLTPSVAWIDTQYIIHWQRGVQGDASILGVRIDGGNEMVDNGDLIARGDPELLTPLLAARPGSGEALSVWGKGLLVQAGRYPTINAPPSSPASMAQFQFDGRTAIALGGATRGSSVVLQAELSDPEGDPLALWVEVKPVGTAFNSSGVRTSGALPSGSTAVITIDGLAIGTSYRWRARAVGLDDGVESPWVDFGGNPGPGGVDFIAEANAVAAIASFEQVDPLSGASIPAGGELFETGGILLRALGSDGQGDVLRLHLELRSADRPFTGEATSFGAFASSTHAELRLTDLPDGAYKWRARLEDVFGGVGPWADYGGTDGGATDFRLFLFGSLGRKPCGAMVSETRGREGLFWTLLFAAAIFSARRR